MGKTTATITFYFDEEIHGEGLKEILSEFANRNECDFSVENITYSEEDTIWELCPHCGEEVKLANKFEKQKCPECNEGILPCSICIEKQCQKCAITNQEV